MMGDRLRELRHLRGLTLRDVARETGLSAALLSQVETGRTTPSVATLRKLASVFDADVATLFHDPEAPGVHVSRPGERFRMVAPAGLITYERLTPGRGEVEVLRADLAPGDVSSEAPWAHASTECLYVLAGQVVAVVGEESHRLDAGESVTFDARLGHRYVNDTADPASILVVVTPPTP